ncbi:hypothetical protein [Methylorubrum extorquens]|uniref:Uncharacterized protein n=1 Tax=Methylorubrum extorquens TaxID=408 RepID=A0AAX3WBG6_METEX|nr:hypothetical protein [Methylorubrum extorquens]WHQ68638.1 hypothetical protein KEC54_20045 [Methylorubrum extorquens]
MISLLLSIVTTPFGIGGGLLALAAVAALVILPTIGRHVALVLAPCVLLFLAMGYVERLHGEVAALTAKADGEARRADAAEAAARANADMANANAAAAQRAEADSRRAADAYQADAAAARSDRNEIDLARRAAALAARACPTAGDPGRRVSEDDELSPSMRAAMDALRAKGTRP